MAMDFPSSPVDGQVSGNYVYSASSNAWKGKPTVGSVATNSSIAPVTANPGDFWYNINTGTLYNYVDDGTSKQWVEVLTTTNQFAPIKLNEQIISANYSIPTGYNGLSAGPITIANGITVTIPNGSSWSIV